MGLFSSNEETEENVEKAFEPVCTDGNRVLGYLHKDSEEDAIVWVKDSAFDTINAEDIDKIV